MSGTAQPISIEIRIKAREDSLVFHSVEASIDALISKAKRQLDALMESYWKWLKFPMWVELSVSFDGNEENRSFIALTIRELITRAKLVIEKMLRQSD